MNLRERAEAAGFWGWTVWPEELQRFALLVASDMSGTVEDYNRRVAELNADTSLISPPLPESSPPSSGPQDPASPEAPATSR